MSELTPNEAKLINAGLLVNKYKELAEKKPQLFESIFEKKIDDYYMIRFEINRQEIETERIIKQMENGDEEDEAILSLHSPGFQQFAYDRCIEGLNL